MSQFDKRIKVNTIIENQLPEFILSDFPNATEFLRQYYISQEFQGGPNDLINNFDQYLKVDNLVPEVVVGVTSISSEISATDTTITVPNTKGFPSEYGLLKIDDEIISYTGITSTSFTGCIRGFSGITGYNVGVTSSLLEVNKETLKFEDTSAASHTSGSSVTNLSVLFIQEFYKKMKKTFLPGLENNDFDPNLDVGNFVKFARSFYQSKGIEESIRILFKVLYGVEATILDLESNLIKPSSSEFIRREVLVTDVIGTGQPANLVGQTIFKTGDLNTSGSVSGVEPFNRGGKTYYKISLFVGYNDRDLIEGVFTIPGNTKALINSQKGASVITVDSTVGFSTSGTIISGSNTIDYTSKSINQFFGCSGINVGINTADDIRADDTIFGYENGDLSKKVELRITGVLSDLVTISDIDKVTEGEHIFVKNVGEKIQNNNSDYKEIFANSWIYNTSCRFQVEGQGPFTLKTEIDKSYLKNGDFFEVLKRNEQVVVANFVAKDVDAAQKTVGVDGLSFIPPFTAFDNTENYDIRRVLEKATSTGVSIGVGNETLISDVLNVYTDGNLDGYVASNSLPNYDIDIDVAQETFVGAANTSNFSDQNPISGLYSFLNFTPAANTKLNLIQGDAIVYDPDGDEIVGLTSGRVYYVDPQEVPAGSLQSKIALYNSRSQIGTASTVLVGVGTTTTGNHRFVLQRHANRVLDADKILRRIPLSQNLFVSSNHDKPVNDIGILINGVQIHSPVSDDNIFFGPLESVDVLNGGDDYDIINPPKITVETGTGTTALVEPILSGSVKKIFVDPQDFDIASVTNISLTGGNGSGCLLEPVLGARFRDISFDSRDIFFNGGVDKNDETITFRAKHNLENGQKVFYRNEGNPSIGIGNAYDASNTITGTLADGDPYFVRVVNPTTVRIFNTRADALAGIAGINTVGLATDTAASGIHKFRTESKNTLRSVRVINGGSGYQHRKLRVDPAGISTSFNTISFKNHGFSHGEIVEYSPTVGLGSATPKAIQGLSTTSSYYVVKVDDDTFKLSDAGIGGTVTSNFSRGKTVGLGSTGTGYQTFKYPDIKVNIEVSYGSTVTGTINFTPIVTGSFTGAYLYEKGTGYGSSILNHQVKPKISIENGKEAELKPIISNGKIEDVVVVNQGKEYNSLPELVISTAGGGIGAVVRPVIENGFITDTVVINSGIGYSSLTTEVRAKVLGSNGLFGARVRSLTVNNTGRFGDENLTSREDSLTFGVLGYSQDTASNLEKTFEVKTNGEFNNITAHSPIIGWAYDGNPIYGPFGYSDPDNINSTLKILSSSYKKDISKVHDRPNGFNEGFFVDDYFYDGSGDLDIHNGRFCKTPEFPKGIYAYFSTVGLSTGGFTNQGVSLTNKLVGVYPYFIGKTYRSPIINDNLILTHDFDFNSSNLIRNTKPYVVAEDFADNDFIVESNEYIRQISNVEAVEKGGVDDVLILDGGSGYKVGDLTSFDNDDTNGSGFSAEVSEIVGIGISNIETTLTRFNNAVFTWNSSEEVQVNYLPFIELNDEDSVFTSGLSTSIPNLTDSFKIGVSTDTVSLGKSMTQGNLNGIVQDIFVNKIPTTVSVGGSIRIGVGNSTEILKVLNIFDTQKALRVFRNTGVAHTFGSNVDILNNRFTIPVKTDKFTSKVNDIVYFNGVQSVGVGTSGVGRTVNYVVGETLSVVSIPERAIYLPNHPFVTGQKVTLTRPNVSNAEFDVSPNNSAVGSFELPFTGQTSTDVFVIKKDENYIGLVTTRAGVANTSDGLYFLGNGVSGIGSGLYNIVSHHEQVLGDVDKVITKVTTKVAAANTTTHNLQNGDIISLNVIPNNSVGIGTTTPISVRYNSEFEKLIINPITFGSADVETNRLDIDGHGFVTGDKVLYDGSATGLSTGSYFVYKVSDRYFQLGETLKDVTTLPINTIAITANTGGANQSIAPINPRITVVKNQKLTFGLSSTTLADFDFKLFYDQDLTNEYLSSQDTTDFNVVGVGTIGIGTSPDRPIVGAALTVQFSASTPDKLYYGLSKGGFISTSDTDAPNYAEIVFTDSVYNGEYKISGVTSETFNISPNVPEFLRYSIDECDTLEYSTKSHNVIGTIKEFKILSSGYNYKKLPQFNTIVSANGVNANLKALSSKIGKIKKVRIVDIGYEYSADKTLSPEAFIPPIVNIDNLDVVDNVEVQSGGSNYSNAPNLLLFNPVSNTVVDDSSLEAIVPNQTISDVKVLAPINGLDSVNHRVVAVNNSNGVGINSVMLSTYPNAGVVTCFLETPTNGFATEPFAINDKVFVEGILRIGEAGIGATQGGITTNTTVTGDGFNSENHNYEFFNVDNYIAGTPSQLIFSVAGFTTNPGIAKTFQSGYATLINKKNYPQINPKQQRGAFELNEPLKVGTVKTDLKVVEIRDDYIKIDGLFNIKKGDRVTGTISGVSAEIVSLVDNKAKFKIDFSSRQEYGWLDDTGKLDEDYQVMPDNNYYQNLSYSVKSPVEWNTFVSPVNRLVHPSGLKNFADTSVNNNVKVGLGTTSSSLSTIILDVVNDKARVDAINNFDFVKDFDTLNNKSKNLQFTTKVLTDFSRCISNRVLIHDDISSEFSSVGFSADNSVVETITADFGNYLIQIIDPDTFDTQFSEVVVLTDEDDIVLFDKTLDFTNIKLGDLKTEITSTGDKNLIFEPTEKFTRDHDVKVLKIDFNSDLVGINTNSVGSVRQTGSNIGISSGSTVSIAEFPRDDFNALYANIYVENSFTKDVNYNEVIVDFDGNNTSISQIYVDKNLSGSGSVVGIITAKLENNLIKLQIENNLNNDLEARANIVGLGTTTTGIGTYRFNVSEQPAGAERSVRLESGYTTGTASAITYTTLNKNIDSSSKSLVRVSCGDTSAIHQIISIRDADDILTVQYPFVSMGSTTGIGTFGGEIVGDDINLRFYPDSEFTSLIEVQSYNQIFYTENDFDNTPPKLNYGTVSQEVFLSTYDGLAGRRANKTKFDLKFEGTPIYSKIFNPSSGILSTTTGTFTIPNHFYNTNEEITYTPGSTFIGIAATALSIGSTANTSGVVTTILPSTVYAKVIDENKFQLFSRPEYIATGVAITFTGIGSGNAHKLSMSKQLTKTMIGLDGVVQQPITFTSINHTLDADITNTTTQFVLSGIGSIQPTDVLKINDEYMKIEEVGFSSLPTGTINDATDVSLGISTLPVVKVERGVLGIGATPHSANDIVRVHRGSFNIVDSSVYFIEPPKGNTRSRRTNTNLPFVKAEFSGRTFLRSDYTSNMLFDDISDNFTGIGKTYSLTVGGANTAAGISTGNGVLFINGIFQTPLTTNNDGHNYNFIADTTAGISTVEFTGISSDNGQFIVSESDINQNQVPRGGLIVSLGSTPGLGYAPLQGAKASLFKNSAGAITSVVGIATTSGINYGISTAAYDNITGIITVTTDKVHGFSLGRPNTVQLKGLEFRCPKTVVGTPTNATYNPANGELVLTIANHGLVNGDAVVIDDNAITFTCSKDSNATNHSYPRPTDPASGQYLTVSNVTTNTFKVNVGASAPSDQYVHTFVSAVANSVKTIGGGGYVGVTTTIFQDHDRPLFLVGIVSERTFEVQAGASTIPHTYQGGGHAYEFFEDNTFGSGYRGGTVAIGVTDEAYVHKFVSSGIGSIRKGSFNGDAFTATNAEYESHSGLLTLTIPNHTFTTSDTVGIDTGGLVFKCSKDGFFGNHPYPRNISITGSHSSGKDPFAGIQTGIGVTTPSTITFNVGQGGGGGTGANITATVGVGGTLAFNIVSAGTSYVNPKLIIPEPTYENLPVVGVSRLGIGATTDTGANLLLNVEVGASRTSVGIGSTLFEINSFSVSRPGHSFKVGDRFKPVGLVTASHLSAPIQEFELEVIEIFRDKFSAWQFGEIDFIDDIKVLQDGQRTRFPLFFNGQILSFEKDPTNATSQLIDLDAVLLIFINGVLQKPKSSYQFEGGSTFTFNEPPTGESSPGANDHDKVDIFFYKGQEGVDVIIKDVQETVKVGDEFRVLKNEELVGITTGQENDRIMKQILGADLVETDIYTGLGIDETNNKPVRWEKQKVDIVLNGEVVNKTRSSIEPQIYPTAKIIGDFSTISGTSIGNPIFVDDATSFHYEKERYGKSGDNKVDAFITSGEVNVGASATAIVSAAGTITSIDITNAGSGYSSAIVKIGAPRVGVATFIQSDGTVGIATTAIATATVTNGSISAINVTNAGFGYSNVYPPQVIIELPPFQTEKINTIENVEGYTGIITGIQQTTRSGGGPALKFFFYTTQRNSNGVVINDDYASLLPGYPILITGTKVGNGLTSINGVNASVVGVGTTFLDNIYIVKTISGSGVNGEIVCDVHTNSASSISGINTVGFHEVAIGGVGGAGLTTSLGQINWGRLYSDNLVRANNPISIGVTGLTVDAGLSTFPTIQRKNHVTTSVRGLRSTGAIRAFGL